MKNKQNTLEKKKNLSAKIRALSQKREYKKAKVSWR